MAHRAGRVIDTDTLRISLVVQVSSDGQEREQDSDDNPNVNVHESRPAAAIPLSNLASRQYTRNIFQRTYVGSDRKSMGSRRVSLCLALPHLYWHGYGAIMWTLPARSRDEPRYSASLCRHASPARPMT
jgi:hypothetical protein